MKRIAFSVCLLLSSSVMASSDYEIIYETGKSKVVLTKQKVMSESQLNDYGRSACSSNRFCTLWFYSDKEQSQAGVKAIRQGDMFAQTPGMYGIFSKNKVTNNVICYEPSGGC